jgi:hypothetical protein
VFTAFSVPATTCDITMAQRHHRTYHAMQALRLSHR